MAEAGHWRDGRRKRRKRPEECKCWRLCGRTDGEEYAHVEDSLVSKKT